ncbi:integrase catalytic domain-containing protein [Trichonephila clavipes]|nr:integrase catalytic domain-containing protein [Trichonephila clavipes]
MSIHPEEREFLRFFLWKDYEESKMNIYRHKRLVFRLSCSPFLFGAVINNLLENCPQKHPVIAKILKKMFWRGQVFDPIGFTCPVTVVPKLLLQETWRKKIGWDERLPMYAEKMIQWLRDLANLNIIKIPRCVIPLEFR